MVGWFYCSVTRMSLLLARDYVPFELGAVDKTRKALWSRKHQLAFRALVRVFLFVLFCIACNTDTTLLTSVEPVLPLTVRKCWSRKAQVAFRASVHVLATVHLVQTLQAFPVVAWCNNPVPIVLEETFVFCWGRDVFLVSLLFIAGATLPCCILELYTFLVSTCSFFDFVFQPRLSYLTS